MTMINPLAPNWSAAEKSGLAENTLKDLMKIKGEVIEAEGKVKELRNGDDREALHIWEKRLESRRESYTKVRSHLVMYGGIAPTLAELDANKNNDLLASEADEEVEEVEEAVVERPEAEFFSRLSPRTIYSVDPCKISDAIGEAWTLRFITTLGAAGQKRLLKNAKEATDRMRRDLPPRFLEWLSSENAAMKWGEKATPELRAAIKAFAIGEEGWEEKFDHGTIYTFRHLIFAAISENEENPSTILNSRQVARRVLKASEQMNLLAVIVAEDFNGYDYQGLWSHHLLSYAGLLPIYAFDPEDDGYLDISILTTGDDEVGLNDRAINLGRIFFLLRKHYQLKPALKALEAIGAQPYAWIQAWKATDEGKAEIAKIEAKEAEIEAKAKTFKAKA